MLCSASRLARCDRTARTAPAGCGRECPRLRRPARALASCVQTPVGLLAASEHPRQADDPQVVEPGLAPSGLRACPAAPGAASTTACATLLLTAAIGPMRTVCQSGHFVSGGLAWLCSTLPSCIEEREHDPGPVVRQAGGLHAQRKQQAELRADGHAGLWTAAPPPSSSICRQWLPARCLPCRRFRHDADGQELRQLARAAATPAVGPAVVVAVVGFLEIADEHIRLPSPPRWRVAGRRGEER